MQGGRCKRTWCSCTVHHSPRKAPLTGAIIHPNVQVELAKKEIKEENRPGSAGPKWKRLLRMPPL